MVVEIDDLQQLYSLVGQEVVITEWIEVSQARINLFAEATDDWQWIHVNPERAQKDSIYGTAIAHGFLTLSLISRLMSQSIKIRSGVKMGINYGLNQVRFLNAVPAGDCIRAYFTPQAIENVPWGVQVTWGVRIESQITGKICCVVEWLVRYYK